MIRGEAGCRKGKPTFLPLPVLNGEFDIELESERVEDSARANLIRPEWSILPELSTNDSVADKT
jgi:hypothetical protein